MNAKYSGIKMVFLSNERRTIIYIHHERHAEGHRNNGMENGIPFIIYFCRNCIIMNSLDKFKSKRLLQYQKN